MYLELLDSPVALDPTPIEKELSRSRYRMWERLVAPADLKIVFPNPLMPERRMVRRVRDLCREGLSFFTHPSEDIGLHPELEVLEVRLERDGEILVHLTCVVRHVSENPGDFAEVCGLHAIPRSIDDERAWEELLASCA
ncbi:MAG: hypothetical protein U0166_13250 [Acidobacteriota bacterium]